MQIVNLSNMFHIEAQLYIFTKASGPICFCLQIQIRRLDEKKEW